MAKKGAYALVLLILVAVLLFSGVKLAESLLFNQSVQDENDFVSKVITREGTDYYPRQDITVILLLGIDKMGQVESSGSYNNTGLADFVALLVVDEKDETYSVLHLNRDTMLNMRVIGLGGKPAGTKFGQLALSHTFGSGLEDSCENTKATVSDFLYGVHVDYYVSLNMGAVPALNDAVGGVTVTVGDDFSDVDPSITEGEFTLHGEQALHYVRTRKDVGDQLNITRMSRQAEYIDGLARAYRAKMEESDSFIVSVYEELSPYLVTDCSANTISNLFQKYSGYQLKEIVSPKGDNVLDSEYYEFHVDEADLDQLIVRMFYAPK